MYWYILLFLISIFLGAFWERKDNTSKSLITLFLFLIVWIFVGFKYEVGSDSLSYLRIYQEVSEYEGIKWKFPDFSYYLLNAFSIWLEFNIQFVYVVVGFFISYFTIRSATQININPCYFFAIIMPFHIVMLGISGVRQGVAESIYLYGISNLLLNNKNGFTKSIIAAVTFHTSAIFFSVFYFITSKKRYFFIALLILIPFLFIIGRDNYGHYSEISLYNQGIFLRVGYLICMGILMVGITFFIKFNGILEKRLSIVIIISGPVLSLLGIMNSTLSDRISYYFILLATIFIMHLLAINNIRLKKYIIPIMLSLSFISLLAFCFFGNARESYEYNNYLFYLLGEV